MKSLSAISTLCNLPMQAGALKNGLLVWLLCGTISAQSLLLPQPGALPQFAESQRQSEEESDPVESPWEEQEGQFLAASSHRDRHLHSGPSGRHTVLSATSRRVVAGRANPCLCRPAEHCNRNGSGGPLRC